MYFRFGDSEKKIDLSNDIAKNETKKDETDPPKIKCVVWDLDNTMWTGVISENDNVVLNHAVVDVVRELDRRGILNSIASKNDFDEAIKKLGEFDIAKYFLCPQINWGMKSDSIKKIADVLDIGIDTLAFVDDMGYERGEVATVLPMVRTYDPAELYILMSSSEVDVPITEASALRRQSYIEIAKRNSELIKYKGDLASFVKVCNIKVDIHKPVETEYSCCAELIQRTNQLNLSGEKLTTDELVDLFNREDVVSQVICLQDRYGDYGLVGLALYVLDQVNKQATMKHFVMSCRAARKLVEHSYFEYMIEYFKGLGYQAVAFDCLVTAKNVLLRKSIEDICGEIKEEIGNKRYRLSVKCESYKPKYKDLMELVYNKS